MKQQNKTTKTWSNTMSASDGESWTYMMLLNHVGIQPCNIFQTLMLAKGRDTFKRIPRVMKRWNNSG